MGCWNETCVLTRTPIGYGKPVVALTTVHGPEYKQESGGAFTTALLFGLPIAGAYNDYGGIENLDKPRYEEFADRAFAATGLYRHHTAKKKYGMATSRLVANSADVFWGAERELQPLFFTRLGVGINDANSYDEAARAKTSQARQASQDAVAALGAALQAATYPEGDEELLEHLFAAVKKAFGDEQAWAAWQFLQRKGLFAHRDVLMMHTSAYQAVVDDFSTRKVYRFGEKQRAPLRDFLRQELTEWPPLYTAELKRLTEMFADAQHVSDRMVSSMAVKNLFMRPLTAPWTTPEAPLTGHFWGGASVTEVLEAHDFEDILDFMVFQWARGYLRIDLTKPSSGSQCNEAKLHQRMMQAVYKTLQDDKRLVEDFYGCVQS